LHPMPAAGVNVNNGPRLGHSVLDVWVRSPRLLRVLTASLSSHPATSLVHERQLKRIHSLI
jgi:hypothetical protein